MTAQTALPAVVTPGAPVRLGAHRLTDAASKAASTDPAELLLRWFGSLSPLTVRKYRHALRSFGAWAIADGDAGAEAVMRLLCSCGPAAGHAMAEGWRDDLLAAGKAPGTVAGSLSALASLLTACRRVGLVAWSLESVSPKPERRCDRRGPPRHEVERLVEFVEQKAETGDRRAVRDLALLRLLHNAALRRAEVLGLRYPDDVEFGDDGPLVRPRRKGHTERTRVLIGRKAGESLREWLNSRGDWPGPLFHRLHGYHGETDVTPLSGEALRQLLQRRARRAGLKAACRPHGLRHAAATEVARRGSLGELQALGGWRSLSAAAHYLDERQETRQRAIAQVEV